MNPLDITCRLMRSSSDQAVEQSLNGLISGVLKSNSSYKTAVRFS